MGLCTVVTGAEPGAERELRDFAVQFVRARDWPMGLVLYAGAPVRVPAGCETRWLPAEFAEFSTRHASNPAAHGLRALSRWGDRERASGYSARFDAGSCLAAFCLRDAALKQEDRTIIWLDRRLPLERELPIRWMTDLPDPVTYAGSDRFGISPHFFAVRRVRDLLDTWCALYESDEVFDLGEWHAGAALSAAMGRLGVLGRDVTSAEDERRAALVRMLRAWEPR
jgi:hypothetical protein